MNSAYYEPVLLALQEARIFEGAVAVGSCGGVCVKGKKTESFGVVNEAGGQIKCTTCLHGQSNCEHVQQLHVLLHEQEDELPPALQAFKKLLSNSRSQKSNFTFPPSCIFSKQIPFDLSTSLRTTLQKSLQERFQITESNGISHLVPDSGGAEEKCCSECKLCVWEDEFHIQSELYIVLPNKTVPAKGVTTCT